MSLFHHPLFAVASIFFFTLAAKQQRWMICSAFSIPAAVAPCIQPKLSKHSKTELCQSLSDIATTTMSSLSSATRRTKVTEMECTDLTTTCPEVTNSSDTVGAEKELNLVDDDDDNNRKNHEWKDCNDDQDNYNDEHDDDDEGVFGARSSFGTKEYWDDVYKGQGDFPADEYSWYYGWDNVYRHVRPHLIDYKSSFVVGRKEKQLSLFIPGIGNDPVLLDILRSGWFGQVVGQDYSSHAIDRQNDILSHYYYDNNINQVSSNEKHHFYYGSSDDDDDDISIELCCGNVKKQFPTGWDDRFDVILEKGLLDAVYLSSSSSKGGGEDTVGTAVRNLARTLRPGGIFISVSGVVPEELRQLSFPGENNSIQHDIQQNDDDDCRGGEGHHHHSYCWKWLRDGVKDLAAGCFIFQKILV